MEKFLIKGPSRVKGEVNISGSKNSALPILASTLLFDKKVTINNLPRVKDINTCLLYTSPSPRDKRQSRMPSSA